MSAECSGYALNYNGNIATGNKLPGIAGVVSRAYRGGSLGPGISFHTLGRQVHFEAVRHRRDLLTRGRIAPSAGAEFISLDGEHHQPILASHYIAFEDHPQQALVVQPGRPRERNTDARAALQRRFGAEGQPHTAHILGLADSLDGRAIAGRESLKPEFRVHWKTQPVSSFV